MSSAWLFVHFELQRTVQIIPKSSYSSSTITKNTDVFILRMNTIRILISWKFMKQLSYMAQQIAIQQNRFDRFTKMTSIHAFAFSISFAWRLFASRNKIKILFLNKSDVNDQLWRNHFEMGSSYKTHVKFLWLTVTLLYVAVQTRKVDWCQWFC